MGANQSELMFDDVKEHKLKKQHFRMIVTAGAGFFTDAYDLFIIGVVTAILAPMWHLSTVQLAVLNGASLAAAAVGAIFFGYLLDRVGRKRFYGYEIAILFFGSILSACVSSFGWLLVARVIVGLGIGGDYPSSAIIASEHSGNSQQRGFLVLLVFAMQALGLIIGPLLASLLLSTHLSHEFVWRFLLGIAAVPAVAVFYLRRRIKESPHYARTQDAPVEVSRAVSEIAGVKDKVAHAEPRYTNQKLWQKKWMLYLLGTAGAWFLMDIALYGNAVSNMLILSALDPHASLLHHTLLSVLIFSVFAVPGYVFSARYVDKIGRRNLQLLGFVAIAIAYALIGLVPAVAAILPMFIVIYGLSYFFINFGPNATTFLIPSEIYPTSIRAKAHGISAATGKCGAFIGAFFLPIILKHYGMHTVMSLMAIVSLGGFFISFLLPEMKNRDLSETETTV